MKRYLGIRYSTNLWGNAEPAEIEKHRDAALVCLEHLSGLMCILSLVNAQGWNPEIKLRMLEELTTALLAVGELGMAIANEAYSHVDELASLAEKEKGGRQ